MSFSRVARSRSRVIGIVLLVVLILYTARYAFNASFTSLRDTALPKLSENKPIVAKIKVGPIQKFWNDVFTVYDQNAPLVGSYDDAVQYVDKSAQKKGTNTKEVLLSKAVIPDAAFQELKQKHHNTVKSLPSELDPVTYKKNTNGVVLVGGGRYSWLAYMALLALRDTGSTLPVEIVMPKFNDYERELEFCTVVLPPLGASCVVIPDVLGSLVMLNWNKRLANYQFKSLALVTSSFQNVLLLDSDNLIIENPDRIFDSDLFKENGMITWPDYWTRSISPKFYDIAEVEVNERRRVRHNRMPLHVPQNDKPNLNEEDMASVPFHDLEGAIPDLSTESGQFIINKATHGKTLLLSLYYNIYGPQLYYKLFSLGEQGEGDKDTFVAAATVLKQKFYQVKSYIKTVGFAENGGNFRGVGMGQKNPVEDSKLLKELVLDPARKSGYTLLSEQIQKLDKIIGDDFSQGSGSSVFALHCNYPKLDPQDFLKKDDLYDKENNRMRYRIWGSLKYPKKIVVGGVPQVVDIDFELSQWETMVEHLCEKKLFFVHFEKDDRSDLCKFLQSNVAWLRSNPA